MDNAQKAIMIGVGLFITIIIISAVLLISNLGTGLINDASENLGAMTTGLQNQILSSYDGKVLSGTQLRAAVQQYSGSNQLCVAICNGTKAAESTNKDAGTTAFEFVGAGQLDLGGNVANWTLTADNLNEGGITGDYTKGGASTYSVVGPNISTNRYYKTAVVYDSQGKLIGFVAIQQAQ